MRVIMLRYELSNYWKRFILVPDNWKSIIESEIYVTVSPPCSLVFPLLVTKGHDVVQPKSMISNFTTNHHAKIVISNIMFPDWKELHGVRWHALCSAGALCEETNCCPLKGVTHNNDVIVSAMVSQITGVSIVCSTVGSGEDQRKRQNSASMAFVRGNRLWPMNSPHKRPVTRKIFPFDEVITNAKKRVHVIRRLYFIRL